MRVLAGHSYPRNLIRKGPEEAGSKSEVVFRSPQGLTGDARSKIVALSDEKMVHKGPDAQGIYLHIEDLMGNDKMCYEYYGR